MKSPGCGTMKRPTLCYFAVPSAVVRRPPQGERLPISRELLDLNSPNFTRTSAPNHPTAVPNITSLAPYGRLQSAIKYCTKVRKIGPAGEELNSLATV